MATKIDYANSIDVPEMGTIYLTAAGYVNYPFKGISRESAMGWEEPVWGGELTRSLDFVLSNIDIVDYGLVARLEISYKYMNVQDYIALCAIAKQRICTATYFNRENGSWVYDQEMAFTGNELGKLYKMGTKYLGLQDVSIKLVATNRDRTSIINGVHTITYYANGGTGTIAQVTNAKWSEQQLLADSGFTKSGYTLAGWNTKADGTGLNYKLGQEVTIFGNLTLYAKWDISTIYLTVSEPSSYTLKIYKADASSTKIYINNTLTETSTTSGFQTIQITTSQENSIIKIENEGNWYFYDYCLGDNHNNRRLISVDTSKESMMTKIGNFSFASTNLTSFIIPNSATIIGNAGFYFSNKLETIYIPNTITKVEGSAFQYCSKLNDITIPNSVTWIQYTAFSDCSSLKEISIPSSVSTIENTILENCSNLEILNVYTNNSLAVATSINSSWVKRCNYSKLTIHALSSLDASSSQTAFGKYWNYIDANTMANTVYDL